MLGIADINDLLLLLLRQVDLDYGFIYQL